MLIGVISDTHRYHWAIEKAVEKIAKSDVIIHLGDNVQDVEDISRYFKGKIINVRGNCDFTNNIVSEKLEVVGGKRIFITHGHHYDVKYGLDDLEETASSLNAAIVLYGHTHVSQITYYKGIYFINPGSPALPRDGFRSVASIEIQGDNINPCILNL